MRTLTQLVAGAALVAAGSITAGPLAAQGQIWIVDQAGGPGSHFTNIPPALQVAQDGDTILVRTGTYDGGTITRGISILADTGATANVRVPMGFLFFAGGALEVDGLPTGRTVVIEGLSPTLPAGSFLGSFVLLRNCAGRVHCDNLDANLIGSSGQTATGISVTDCAHVSIHASSLRNGNPMSVQRSTVLITDSTLVGQSAFASLGGTASSSNALGCSDSQLTIARSFVAGGGVSILAPGLPSAAISAVRGTLLITGGAEARVQAGSGFAVADPTNAISGFGATITVDPRVTLVGSSGAAAIAAGHTSTVERVPALSATAGPPGGSLVLDLLATSGDLAEIYLSVPFGPVTSPIPGSGEIWVNFGFLLNLGRFTVPASEQVQLNLTLPAIPSIRGAVLTSQALTASVAAGFRFSTPAAYVLN